MSAVGPSSVSLVLHLSLLTALAAMSALSVMPLPEHGWHVPVGVLYLGTPSQGAAGSSAALPPAAAAAGSGRRKDEPPRVTIPEQPAREPTSETVSQPSSIPRETPAPSADGDDAEEAGGDPNGKAGGVADGSPDGILGGIPKGGMGAGGGGENGSGAGGGTGAPPDAGDVLDFDGTITLPVVVRRVEPVYPPAARMARLEATLRFQIVVDRDGEVIEVRPLKSHPVFERAAMEALSQWKYRPAMQSGRPVKVYLLVTVEFKLLG